MSSAEGQAAGGPAPRIWILHSTGEGANRQLLNLARRLGGTFEVKHSLDPAWIAFFDRILWPARKRIPRSKRDRLRPPWPDLLLIAGGRSLVDAWRVRAASGGACRIVCLGRPGAPLHCVELVITTPQYGLPEHAHVLHLTLPLNLPDREQRERSARRWEPRFSHLPRPWYGVLLGGDSGSFRFTAAAASTLGRKLRDVAAETGGSLLVTTSPRTTSALLDGVLSEIDRPSFCYRWKPDDPENPLEGIFALADRFVVTADSASMLAEACSLGVPVASFEPPRTWRARLLARSWLPPRPRLLRERWSALRARWTANGCWIPARRMERIHAGLVDEGVVCPVEKLNRRDPDRIPVPDDMGRAVAAVRALLETAPAAVPRSGPVVE